MSSITISEPTTKAEYYSILTTKERELSQTLGKTFFDSSRKSVEAIKAAGDALITAKAKLNGKFMYFCKYELPMDVSQDTIEGFMRLATIINERPQLAKYNPTIIFEISKRSTPPEIVEELSALAESDEHQEVKVKDVKEKIAEAKATNIPIKKGSIVEWQMSVKGFTFGRVRSKTTDGIACKIESLRNGKYLGEKATKQLSLCPVQKVHSGIVDTDALKVETGQKVIISPYETGTQQFAGMEGTVIARYPNRRTFTVQVGETIRDFFWEELKLLKEEPTPPPSEEIESVDDENESQGFFDVEAQEINEKTSNIDLTEMGMEQKRLLLKQLVKEMQSYYLYLPNSIINDLDNLVEKTRKEIHVIGESSGVRECFVAAFIDKCL